MAGVLLIGKELTEMTPVVDQETGRRAATLAQVDQGESLQNLLVNVSAIFNRPGVAGAVL